ncbi:MAG: hypothetical protein R6V16_03320 [Bacteroidales bacterium]
MRNITIICLILFYASISAGYSQVSTPVSVTTTLTPPYSTFLNDYYALGSNQLIASVVLNDFNEPSWDVRLKITIESNQVRISTKPNFRPSTPITIFPGAIENISGESLEPYLNYNNINLSGISLGNLQKNGKLPQGFYTFCIEVYDYNSNRLLSKKSCTGALLQLNGAPIIQSPSNGEVIPVIDPLNIPFQWQLSSPAFDANPTNTEYQLTLYKILDPDVNPKNAIANNVVQKIYESGFSPNTSLIYGLSQPPLEIGHKYAFRIQARDVEGKDNFKNNGYSEAGWFHYGYPAEGNLTIQTPPNNKTFTKDEYKRFRWNGPDNKIDGQQVTYKLRIVEINEGQDSLTAFQNNSSWHQQETSPLLATHGGDIMLDKEIETQQAYAWGVTAYTGEQEVAKSAVYKFTGPPVIEWFMAGNHKVTVTKTYNDDLNNLSGKGKVKVDAEGTMHEFEFEHLEIVDAGGRYVLISGTLYSEINNFEPIELSPDYLDNGNAYFYAEALQLNKDRLAIKGIVKWVFPLASDSPNLEKVISEPGWFNYNSFKLLGSISLGNKNKFTLIDPTNYRFEFDSLSNFLVSENKYRLRFFGKILLPEKIKNTDQQRMALPFRNIDNLYYFSQENVRTPKNILLVPNTNIQYKPLEYTADFSENHVIEKVNNNPEWKGIYINRFIVNLKANVDNSNQLKLNKDMLSEVSLTNANQYESWLDSDGLNLKTDLAFSDNNKASYNTFTTEITKLSLEIEQCELKETFFTASMKIPVLKGDKGLVYSIPLSQQGLESCSIEDMLVGEKVSFNPGKEKLQVDLLIKQAIFKDNERLELVVDFDWPGIQTYAANISGLCVWGNGKFGFNIPDGKKALTKHISGKYYDTYDITIDTLTAGKYAKNFLVGVSGSVNLSSDISGKDDAPPRINLASYQNLEFASLDYGGQNWVRDYITLDIDLSSPEDIFANLPFIRINTPVIEFEGGLVIENDHPVWGNAFYGLMDGKIKQPQEYAAKVQFLLGKHEGTSYWFAEIGVSTSGHEPEESKVPAGKNTKLKKVSMSKTGLKVGPLEITGVTGRVYHHMRPEIPIGVDCNMDFDKIDEPGLTEYNLDLEFPDLSMPDVCTILNNLNTEELKKLLCSLNSAAFEAVLEKVPEPDFDDIQNYIATNGPADSEFLNQMIAAEARARIEQGYEDHVQQKYNDFTYARLAKVFPGYDWCQKVIEDNKQGIQWGDILCQVPDLQWPTIPNLCELSEYLFNKVLHELPEPDYDDLEAIMYDEDWSVIKAEYPSITWPQIQEIFPEKNLCKIIMIWPGIDWGAIYLKIPQLPKLEWPDWRLYFPEIPDIELKLPELNIDFALPDISFEPGEIEVDYVIDPSTSYGNYLLVDYVDFAKKGAVVQGTGTMEITFNNSGGLQNIGLEVTSNWGNTPGAKPVIEGLGCMTYNPSNKHQFIGDFFGQSRNKAICGHGKLHIDINTETFNVKLASKASPAVVQPLCADGPVRLTGYFSLDPTQFNVGLGAYVRYGFEGSISSDICNLGVKAEASLKADIFASINYRPDISINEASFHVDFNAGLDVTTGGELCTFGNFNVASLNLKGDLTYYNSTRKISGNVSGHAKFLSIITCNFDLSTEYKL